MLWAYNLNYFDFLLQPGRSQEVGVELIEGFMQDLPSRQVGLEPYPISLRGINWIKFLSLHEIRRSDIDASLYTQYQLLFRNLEYRLLGNHLLENAFSLLFGACYFQQKDWFVKSRKLLIRELEEQVLEDGAHFELSTMYHRILLDRLLDCLNLLQNNSCFPDQNPLTRLLQEKAVSKLRWMKTMTFADGSMPLVNDATESVAPTSGELFAYAGRLGIDITDLAPVSLHGSGYRKFSGRSYECIVDVGAIGPDYIPGHAHADTFNFVAQYDGRPLLVDTGISTYEKGMIRDEERGTAAHNTVVVNGTNSSDVWGGFRVGQRAKVRLLQDSESVIEAEHDGYRRFGVTHRRRWSYGEARITVTDFIHGQAVAAMAFFHLAYDVQAKVIGNAVHVGSSVFEFNGAELVELAKYRQALEFNKTVEARCIVVHFHDSLETTISFP